MFMGGKMEKQECYPRMCLQEVRTTRKYQESSCSSGRVQNLGAFECEKDVIAGVDSLQIAI